MGRLSAVLLFVVAIWSVQDCHAQRQRGLLFRGPLFQQRVQPPIQPHMAPQAEVQSQTHQPSGHPAPEYVVEPVPQFVAPRGVRYYDNTLYPKFIGGFHSSHFHNLGVPSGDIGFRGNGIYWTPW